MFHELYKKMELSRTQIVAVDAGYKTPKETIERIFADAKERHCLRYTNYRGLAKVKVHVALIFSCLRSY